MTDTTLPFTGHLEELRKRLIISTGAWIVAFAACYSYAEQMFSWIAQPMREALPANSSMVFITATEPFFTYLKVAALAALFISLPVILWQFWLFIAPGLYAHERRIGLGFVLSSCTCFTTGAYLGFTHVFPTIFTVLIQFGIGAAGVNAMLSIGSYLSFALMMLLAFGALGEIPILMILLARLGLVDHHRLRKNRKLMLIVAFVFGALITPGPDVLSQCSVAIPFVILYEVGIIGARIFGKPKMQEDQTTAEAPT